MKSKIGLQLPDPDPQDPFRQSWEGAGTPEVPLPHRIRKERSRAAVRFFDQWLPHITMAKVSFSEDHTTFYAFCDTQNLWDIHITSIPREGDDTTKINDLEKSLGSLKAKTNADVKKFLSDGALIGGVVAFEVRFLDGMQRPHDASEILMGGLADFSEGAPGAFEQSVLELFQDNEEDDDQAWSHVQVAVPITIDVAERAKSVEMTAEEYSEALKKMFRFV